MERWRYNTKKGIEQATTPHELYQVLAERRKAAEHGEELDAFYVLGSFLLDENGFCTRLNREIYTEVDRVAAPFVMTEEEGLHWELPIFERAHGKGLSLGEQFEKPDAVEMPDFPIPPPGLACAACENRFDMYDCRNCWGTVEENGARVKAARFYHGGCYQTRPAMPSLGAEQAP